MQTWLSPYASVWRKKYPDALVPFGQLARNFKDLVKAHPAERIVTELQAYLEKTPQQYISLAKFVATFGAWTPVSKPAEVTARSGCVVHPERPWVATSQGRKLCRDCFDQTGA